MDTQPIPPEEEEEDDLPPGIVVGGVRVHPLQAAAVAAGALAAGAGAYLGARALAKRNAGEGKVNSVLAAAITACEVSHKPEERKPPSDED